MSNSFFINIIQSVSSSATTVASLYKLIYKFTLLSNPVNAFSPKIFPVVNMFAYEPSYFIIFSR